MESAKRIETRRLTLLPSSDERDLDEYLAHLTDPRELFEQHEQGVAPFSGIEAALEDLRFEMERDEWATTPPSGRPSRSGGWCPTAHGRTPSPTTPSRTRSCSST